MTQQSDNLAKHTREMLRLIELPSEEFNPDWQKDFETAVVNVKKCLNNSTAPDRSDFAFHMGNLRFLKRKLDEINSQYGSMMANAILYFERMNDADSGK